MSNCVIEEFPEAQIRSIDSRFNVNADWMLKGKVLASVPGQILFRGEPEPDGVSVPHPSNSVSCRNFEIWITTSMNYR
jgi:hypothetical protein